MPTNCINAAFFNANQNITRILITTALPVKKFYGKNGLRLNDFISAVTHLSYMIYTSKNTSGQTLKAALPYLTITRLS